MVLPVPPVALITGIWFSSLASLETSFDCRSEHVAAQRWLVPTALQLTVDIMNETSLSLLDRLRDSPESNTWDRLAEIYTPLIRSWLRKYGVQPPDADDLLQEVLLAVSKDLPRFESMASRFQKPKPQTFRSQKGSTWRSAKSRSPKR